jgi:hypothetical protein
VKKLGVKEGHHLTLIGAPPGWTIDDLPAGVQVARKRTVRPADVVVAFFRDRATLRRQVTGLSRAITADGALWLAWPRRAGGHTSDITDNAVRQAVLPLGLVDVKVAALDEDWSGVKAVWRRELRPGLSPSPCQ